jgi:hypothetical protein
MLWTSLDEYRQPQAGAINNGILGDTGNSDQHSAPPLHPAEIAASKAVPSAHATANAYTSSHNAMSAAKKQTAANPMNNVTQATW